MGVKRTHVCESCNYRVLTSGGPDGGRRKGSGSNTFVCKQCKTLLDLFIESEENRLGSDQKCSKCNGNDFIMGDYENKPCPKCGHQMVIDLGGATLHWD